MLFLRPYAGQKTAFHCSVQVPYINQYVNKNTSYNNMKHTQNYFI